ncbi:MAG: hypothetical protein ACSHW7_01450 [Patiriisocius sp.]|uniref:hypothetical protein n=1 Tax=Patiriisocius sp. TaxID=2822396 RepID=UPI003EF1989F
MKYKLLFLIALLISAVSIAQNGINYKALIKDANGDALVSQGIFVQFQILESGTLNVYQETHDTTTDANGIVVINIGEGTVNSGNFLTVDWGSADHFLNVQVDSGDGFVDLGTTQFKSVPYAMMAETVEKSPVSDFALVKAVGGSLGGKAFFTTEIFDLTNNFEPDPTASFDPLLSRFTASAAGYYKIEVDMNTSTSGTPSYSIVSPSIRVNGQSVKSHTYQVRLHNVADNRDANTVYSTEYLVPGDYVEIFISSSSGTQVNNVTLEIERIR